MGGAYKFSSFCINFAAQTVSSYFDHPKVVSVVLSNSILDSSISTRALLLWQPATTLSDLRALATYVTISLSYFLNLKNEQDTYFFLGGAYLEITQYTN